MINSAENSQSFIDHPLLCTYLLSISSSPTLSFFSPPLPPSLPPSLSPSLPPSLSLSLSLFSFQHRLGDFTREDLTFDLSQLSYQPLALRHSTTHDDIDPLLQVSIRTVTSVHEQIHSLAGGTRRKYSWELNLNSGFWLICCH